jgi:AraC-like DNA-binding protein
MAVRFPNECVVTLLDQPSLIKDLLKQKNLSRVPLSFLRALRQTLMLHLHNPNLGFNLVAHLSALSPPVARALAQGSNTTLSAEISNPEKRLATAYLVGSAKSVARIATSLGFANPTSSARAFKAWTGESPREYRKNQQTR